MPKTKLDIEMEKEGWIKYTHIEKGGLFGMDGESKDLIARLQARNILFKVKPDSCITDSGVNSLYVKKSEYNKVCELFY